MFGRALVDLSFRQLLTSNCLFIWSSQDLPAYLMMYVDKIILAGPSDAVDEVKKLLAEQFNVTDLGDCSHFLGMRTNRTPSGNFLSQKLFIKKVFARAGMNLTKPVPTPFPLSHPLYEVRYNHTVAEEQAMEGIPYRQVLGSLLFLSTRTHPTLRRRSPCWESWRRRLHRYTGRPCKASSATLLVQKNYGVMLPFGGNLLVKAWSDANWVRKNRKRRSRSGYIVTVGGGPVVWSSRRQSLTSQSTTKAEFFALVQWVKEASWIWETLGNFGCILTDAVKL